MLFLLLARLLVLPMLLIAVNSPNLHTNIGRARRQLSVPTILTRLYITFNLEQKMLRKMDFPMSSFKIKLLKALVTTN